MGDLCTYNNQSIPIEKKLVKICDIIDKEMQIVLDTIDEDGIHIYINFWKNNLGKDPNIYKDEDKYKLVEIDKNDIIEIWGIGYEYKGFKQFNPCGGYILSDSEFNLKSSMNQVDFSVKIKQLINCIDNVELRNTCIEMLQQLNDVFYTKPAANKYHHNYVGGLAQHTYEVMATAYNLLKVYKANKDIVLAATLFHDAMKVKEYTDTGEYLPYATRVGHVVGSAEYFKEVAGLNDVDSTTVDEVYHCILAHHGKKEWGSPVEPQTIEAAIVHEADMISSRINPIMLMLSNYDNKDYYLI